MPADVLRAILEKLTDIKTVPPLRLTCRALADSIGEMLFPGTTVNETKWREQAEGLRGIAPHLHWLKIEMGECIQPIIIIHAEAIRVCWTPSRRELSA